MINIQDELNNIIMIAAEIKKQIPQTTLEGKAFIDIEVGKGVVARVLDHSEEARNDYNVLYKLCRAFCDELKIPYTDSTQETWRRSCQYYQNTLGWWEARPEVKAARMAKAEVWSEAWKKPK